MSTQTPEVVQFAQTLIDRYNSTLKAESAQKSLRIFLGAKNSLLGMGDPDQRMMLHAYQIAEKELFGKITLLEGERDLTKDDSTPSPASSASDK